MNKTHKVNLLDFGLTKLETFFETLNEKPFRAKQILRWGHQRGVTSCDQRTELSKSLRDALKAVAELRERPDPRSMLDAMEMLIRTQPRKGQIKKRKKKKKKTKGKPKKKTKGKTKKRGRHSRRT